MKFIVNIIELPTQFLKVNTMNYNCNCKMNYNCKRKNKMNVIPS